MQTKCRNYSNTGTINTDMIHKDHSNVYLVKEDNCQNNVESILALCETRTQTNTPTVLDTR